MRPSEALTHDEALTAAALVVVVGAAMRLGRCGAFHGAWAERVASVFPSAPSASVRSGMPLGLDATGLPAPVPKVAASMVMGVLVFPAAWALSASPLWGAAGAVAAAITAIACITAAGRRNDARVERALPGVVEELARSLRTGASFHQALVDVAHLTPGSVGSDLLSVTNKAALGAGLDHALKEWGAEHRLASVRLFYGALILTMRSGADGGRALDGLAQSMRDKAIVEQETKALVAQAQLSGLVIAALPVVFLGFSLLVDRGGASFLLTTPIGKLCLLIALGLDGVGYVWMRRLAHSVDI